MKIKEYAIVIGGLAGLLFGVATPFSKILLANLNSFQLSGLLYLGSGIVIIPSILKGIYKSHKSKNDSKTNYINKLNLNQFSLNKVKLNKNTLKLLLILLFGGILGPLFLMLGLSYTTSSSTAIWLNMELVFTAFLGVIIFKDHLDKYILIGLSFTFIAGIVISWGSNFGEIIPIVFILFACFSWGIDNQLTSIVDGYSPEFITFVKGIVGGGINFTIGMIIAGSLIPFNIFIFGLILGVFSYGISIVFFASSAQNLGATRSQILFSTAPFWGILLSILLIGEPLTLNILIAAFFLMIGIIITNNLVHLHKHKHKPMEHIHLHSHDDSHHSHEHESLDEFNKSDSGNSEDKIKCKVKDKNKDKNKDKHKKHTHKHKHKKEEHTHKHFPDLHHRHDH